MIKKTFILQIPVEVEMEILAEDGADAYAAASVLPDDFPISQEENIAWLKEQWSINLAIQKVFQGDPAQFKALVSSLLTERLLTGTLSDQKALDHLNLPDARQTIAQAAKETGGHWHLFPEGRAPSHSIEETAEPLLDSITINLGEATIHEKAVAPQPSVN